ncbi:acylneuraminate cytidylyltransferase family protein [Marinilabiliaceae bacterium ANBcel2]|nr:acylneuraminate cytidylyltransferase family protein [Marinilabiliaceae bacterium ANBcel2]
MKVIAIIPARAGSKGVPGKNIKPLKGKPLINYTVDTALSVPELDEIVVSSDSDDLLNCVKNLSLFCSKRPDNLATDSSDIADTILYELNRAEKRNNQVYDYIVLLQPTSLFRTKSDISQALSLIYKTGSNSLISVIKMEDPHPARMYYLDDFKTEGGTLNTNIKSLYSLFSEFEDVKRQNLPDVYSRNGSIYITKRSEFLKTKKVMCKPSVPFIMDKYSFVNIDSEIDWLIAEALIDSYDFNK